MTRHLSLLTLCSALSLGAGLYLNYLSDKHRDDKAKAELEKIEAKTKLLELQKKALMDSIQVLHSRERARTRWVTLYLDSVDRVTEKRENDFKRRLEGMRVKNYTQTGADSAFKKRYNY